MGELLSAIFDIFLDVLFFRGPDISKFKEPSQKALDFCHSFYSKHNVEKLNEGQIICLIKTNLTSFKHNEVKLSDMFVLIYLKKLFDVNHLKKINEDEQKEYTKKWIEFKKKIPKDSNKL